MLNGLLGVAAWARWFLPRVKGVGSFLPPEAVVIAPSSPDGSQSSESSLRITDCPYTDITFRELASRYVEGSWGGLLLTTPK